MSVTQIPNDRAGNLWVCIPDGSRIAEEPRFQFFNDNPKNRVPSRSAGEQTRQKQ
jgi:hypothetical protein